MGDVCLQRIRRQAQDMCNLGDGTVPVEAEIESRRAKLLRAAVARLQTRRDFLASRQCVSSTWFKKSYRR